MKIQMTSGKADLLLLFLSVVWGSGYCVSKAAVSILSPVQFLTWRFLISAILSIIIFHKKLRCSTKSDLLPGFLMGVLLSLCMLIQTIGLQYTSAGKAIFLGSAFVLIVPFLYWLIGKEKPTFKILFAALIMMAGLALMSSNSTGLDGLNIGDIYVLISTVFFAIYTVIVAVYGSNRDPFLLSSIQYLTCGAFFLLTSIFDQNAAMVTTDMVIAIFYSSVVITFLGFIVQVFCLKYTSPNKSAIIINLETVFGSIIAVIFLGESYDLKMIISFFIIFISALIAEVNFKELNLKSLICKWNSIRKNSQI